MKYVDAEKLKAEIGRQISEWQALIDNDNATCPTTVKTLIYELKNILCFIKSLEKEQDCLYGYSPENRFCDECSSKLCDARKPPKIKGWMTRDKDSSLTFFSVKPIKFEEYAERWYVPGACTICYLGFCDFYKDLKWEDEPIEVELTIHRV